MSADLPSQLPREPTSVSVHYGRQKCRWVCLCIRLLTDLDLFTVCPLVSIIHYPLAVAKLNAEKGQKIQDRRKPLCQPSDGEGRKAVWSCCARVCFDHEAPLLDMSHAAITQTLQTLEFFLNTGTLMRQLSVLTGTLLFPLIFFLKCIFAVSRDYKCIFHSTPGCLGILSHAGSEAKGCWSCKHWLVLFQLLATAV